MNATRLASPSWTGYVAQATSAQEISSSSMTDVNGLTLTVPATATTDSVFMFINLNVFPSSSLGVVTLTINRDNTDLATSNKVMVNVDHTEAALTQAVTFAYMDIPASIGSFEYKVRGRYNAIVSWNSQVRQIGALVVPSTTATSKTTSFTVVTVSSTNYENLGVDTSVVTSFISDRVLISTTFNLMKSSGGGMMAFISLYRNDVKIDANAMQIVHKFESNPSSRQVTIFYLDHPDTSGSVTYSVRAAKVQTDAVAFTVCDGGNYMAHMNLMVVSDINSNSATALTSALIVSTDWTEVGLSTSITPASIKDQVLITVNINFNPSVAAASGAFTIFRGSTNLGDATYGLQVVNSPTIGGATGVPMSFLDSPNTDTSVTYTVKVRGLNTESFMISTNDQTRQIAVVASRAAACNGGGCAIQAGKFLQRVSLPASFKLVFGITLPNVSPFSGTQNIITLKHYQNNNPILSVERVDLTTVKIIYNGADIAVGWPLISASIGGTTPTIYTITVIGGTISINNNNNGHTTPLPYNIASITVDTSAQLYNMYISHSDQTSSVGTISSIRIIDMTSTDPTAAPTAAPTTKAPTLAPTINPSANPTVGPTVNPSAKPTVSPTVSPTSKPTFAPTTWSPTVAPTLDPTAAPTLSPTRNPTLNPSANPSVGPSVGPSVMPTLVPTVGPTPSPTLSPTLNPTRNPSANPSVGPSVSPSAMPTLVPTVGPTPSPTLSPTVNPTRNPSANPSVGPSVSPSTVPTLVPTTGPTPSPTLSPTVNPTRNPSANPSVGPSVGPSVTPTVIPTAKPTVLPTCLPTLNPTINPTVNPSINPSASPSRVPSLKSTAVPTCLPTEEPSDKPTASPSVVPSASPSVSPSLKPSAVPTVSPSVSPTFSPSVTPSLAPSVGPSVGPTLSPTITPSMHPSRQPTVNPSAGPSQKPSTAPSPSKAPSTGPTVVPSVGPSTAPSAGPTVNPSVVPSVVPTVNPSKAPTVTPSASPSAGPSAGPSISPSNTPTTNPSVMPSSGPSAVPSAGPTAGPSTAPSVSPTLNPSVAPSAGPTVSPTVGPSAGPSVSPSSAPTEQPSVSPSVIPTAGPSAGPSAAPSAQPSAAPTASPSTAPSTSPSANPTVAPTEQPSADPSASPSANPSADPSADPSAHPSAAPSATPSIDPSVDPTVNPTANPTEWPSAVPSISPSIDLTVIPTADPTVVPSVDPSVARSTAPSEVPSSYPTTVPTELPSISPTVTPSVDPSVAPSANPSTVPTMQPSVRPTVAPSTTPTVSPSTHPSAAPSVSPTHAPTAMPSTTNPTTAPTVQAGRQQGDHDAAAAQHQQEFSALAVHQHHGHHGHYRVHHLQADVGTNTLPRQRRHQHAAAPGRRSRPRNRAARLGHGRSAQGRRQVGIRQGLGLQPPRHLQAKVIPELWKPDPGALPASGNYVYLQGSGGDYIAGNRSYLYRPSDTAFTLSASSNHLSVRVAGDQDWTGDFKQSGTGTRLAPGYYGELTRYPFQEANKGGLNWSGEGRGCNTLKGCIARAARSPARPEAAAQRFKLRADLPEQQVRVGIAVGYRAAFAHPAAKVDQQQVDAAAPDLDADEPGAVGIEPDRHRRLPDLAALRRAFEHQALVEQAVDDQRDGLCAEPGQARQAGFRHAAVQADGLQQHPMRRGAASSVLRGAGEHALAEQEIGVGLQFARLHDGVRLPDLLVEGKALDRNALRRRRRACRPAQVHKLALQRRAVVRRLPRYGHEADRLPRQVEREHRQDGRAGARQAGA
eukprot:gene14395-16534_t